jgi:hypothetical protein
MKIKDYIKDLLGRRLGTAECLVVYDPEGRYRDLTLALESSRCRVVDGSVGTIQSREEATAVWLQMGAASSGSGQLLLRLPVRKPLTDEEKQLDPFQAFTLGGDVFPRGDGDSYLSLCLQAKPGFQDQIYDLFKAGAEPSFSTVDALDSSSTWPQLRTLLSVESPREILVGLLCPTDAQKASLQGDGNWFNEYRQFAQSVLGLQPYGNVSGWEDLRDVLARFVLFSEFAFDLPTELPPALHGVPRADEGRRNIVYVVCEQLRDARTLQGEYIALANQVSRQLDLPAHMPERQDYGSRDTFLFEERAFLRRCIEAADKGDLGTARNIVDQRRKSIWAQAEERGTAWTIADRGLELQQGIIDLEAELVKIPSGMAPLIGFYVDRGRRADTLHRNFERTVDDSYGQIEGLERLIDSVRHQYREFADALQRRFLAALRSEGWPVSGFTRQTQVFRKHLAPALERQQKVAFFLMDAMRYELAAEFMQRLPEAMKSDLQSALAQIPTITPVGMAALLPEADGRLRLTKQNGELVPTLDGKRVRVPDERIEYVRSVYGDRVQAMDLEDLLKTRKPKLKDTVDLIMVKTTEIDEAGERKSGPPALGLMQGVLEKSLRAIKVLQEMGVQKIVFSADHGFLLLSEQLPGDKVNKPDGQWLIDKERCLAGIGGQGLGTACFEKEDVGVDGDLEQIVVPESLGAFKTGSTFMHSGLSLQECVIPVVTIELGVAAKAAKLPSLQLQYRGGRADRITTRRPMIEVVLFQPELFEPEMIQFSLEAKAGKKVVGLVAPSSNVDPTTGLVTVESGTALKVPLRMDDAFEGEFIVTAIDPVTGVTFGTPLTLRTDYME